MALYIKTQDKNGLVEAIKKKITDGKILTWKFVQGKGFTHVTSDAQWENKAYLWPVYTNAEWLILGLHAGENLKMTKARYGVYHGRFIEMLLTHFHSSFKRIEPSVTKDTNDKFDWALELKLD